MSGGSYDYLCSQDAAQLLAGGHAEQMQEMRGRLLELGAADAAEATAAIITNAERGHAVMEARVTALYEIWKAVEWHDSGDWGADRIDSALARYRARKSIGLSDAELLGRAVRNATGPGLHPRWACVCEVFAIGSNYAQALCRRFGLDPDESVGEAYPQEDGGLDEVELAPDGSSDTEDP